VSNLPARNCRQPQFYLADQYWFDPMATLYFGSRQSLITAASSMSSLSRSPTRTEPYILASAMFCSFNRDRAQYEVRLASEERSSLTAQGL
jgi:hypothetical protein